MATKQQDVLMAVQPSLLGMRIMPAFRLFLQMVTEDWRSICINCTKFGVEMKQSLRVAAVLVSCLLVACVAKFDSTGQFTQPFWPDYNAWDTIDASVFRESRPVNSDVVVEFTYDPNTYAFNVVKVYDSSFPTDNDVHETYVRNYNNYKSSKKAVMTDYIQLMANGEYSINTYKGKDMLSVFSGDYADGVLLMMTYHYQSRWRNISMADQYKRAQASMKKDGVDINRMEFARLLLGKMLTIKLDDMFLAATKAPAQFAGFVEQYPNYFSITRDKGKVVSALRSMNTFEGYYQAYGMTKSVEDAKAMDSLAKSQKDRKLLETVAVAFVKDKSSIFSMDFTLSETKARQVTKSGFLVVTRNATARNFKGRVNVRMNPRSPIPLKYAPHKVFVKLQLHMKYHSTRQSQVLGNYDRTNDRVETRNIVLTVSPPSYASSQEVDFGDWNISYADRGAMGGMSTEELVEDPSITWEITNVE